MPPCVIGGGDNPAVGDVIWTASAVAVLAAIRGRAGYSRTTDARDAISAIACDTMPGETVTGQALLDQSVWPSAPKFITGPLRGIAPASTSPIHVDYLVFAAADEARRAGARKVGERHLMTAFWGLAGTDIHLIELNRDKLLDRIRELELGPGMASEIEGRWHGLVDTNAVIHFKDLHSIDWRAETHQSQVTIWATTVLLDELDELAFEAGPRSKARQRARVFNRWLRPHIRDAMQPTGYDMREGVKLRLWVPPLSARPPDGQHLDAAEGLADRGVPVHVVSNDNGMIARAIARDLDAFQLSEGALLDDNDGAQV
jgi:hypothetical protein